MQAKAIQTQLPSPSPVPSHGQAGRPGLGGIVPDWHESAQGKEYLACVLRKSRRRVFGERLRCLSRVGGAHLGRGRRREGEGTLPACSGSGGHLGEGGGIDRALRDGSTALPHPQEP